MLKFDTAHKRFKNWIKYENPFIKFAEMIVAGTLIITMSFPFVAHALRTSDCDINGDHAHLYMDPDTKIERYIDSEYYENNGLIRLEDYKMISEEEAQELKFMNKYDLFRIDQNIEQLQLIEEMQKDQKEYRYNYKETVHWSTPIKMGKGWSVIHHSKDVDKYSWTTNKNENLTGEERDVHYMYYAYKVVHDENGKTHLEQSELVNDLSELSPEYKYISRDFYKTVDPLTHEVLDYEDGTIKDNGFKVELNRESIHEFTTSDVKDQMSDLQIDNMLDDFDNDNNNENTINLD